MLAVLALQVGECGELELQTDAPLKGPPASLQLPGGPCQLTFQATSVGQYASALLVGGEQLPGSFGAAAALNVVARAGQEVDPGGTFMLPARLPTTVAAGGRPRGSLRELRMVQSLPATEGSDSWVSG